MRNNQFFKAGDFVEIFDSGGIRSVQKVRTEQKGGKLLFGGNEGLCVPSWLVADDLLELRKNGIDLACLNRRRSSL